MNHSNLPDPFPLAAPDGLKLMARQWDPRGELRGHIGIVHGLGEHTGRYGEVAEYLTKAGYRVLAIDQRGHGLTAGKRGHVDDFTLLLDDIGCLVKRLGANPSDVPRFLYGHSLGGNLVLSFILRRHAPMNGLIISSPLLEPALPPPRWKLTLAKLVNHFWPSLTLSSGITSTDLTHDQDAVARRESDPLIHNRVSARLALQMLQAGHWLLEHAGELGTATLMLHGGQDRITSLQATRRFSEQAGPECELYVSEAGYHELHREEDRDATLSHITAWLDQQCRAAPR